MALWLLLPPSAGVCPLALWCYARQNSGINRLLTWSFGSAGEKNESEELRFQTKWSGELVVRRAPAATGFMLEMDLPLERMDAKTPEWAHDSSVLIEVQCCNLAGALEVEHPLELTF